MTKNTQAFPHHIAIVMDGNGRWAKKRFLPRSAGHQAGRKAVERIINAALEKNIAILTLFAFSSENWLRPADEVNSLMTMFMKGLTENTQALHEQQVRIRFIGQIDGLDVKLQEKMVATEALTKNNSRLQLVLAINYCGQLDIVQATKTLSLQVLNKELDVNDISIERFNATLYSTDLAPPDLFIRTSGELRLSNFLLWQLAYSELYFTETLWPDFDEKALDLALTAFAARKRRYGVLK
jgi:undecaprenyl diphosphate synthase